MMFTTNRRYPLIFFGVLAVLLIPVLYFSAKSPQTASAAWFDEAYRYRQRFSFTHNADISEPRAITFTLDTAELIAAGVMQADCDDTRFTDINGQVLAFDLTGTCDNSATTYEVIFPSIINGSNVAYVYYGNPSASNVEIDSTGYTALTPSGGDPSAITNRTNEENTPGPVGYWKFDEGVENTCPGGTNDACDSAGNGSDGAFSGSTKFLTQDLCLSGTCVYFDGSNDDISIANNSAINDTASQELTLSFWVKINDFSLASIQSLVLKGDHYGCSHNTSNQIECSAHRGAGWNTATTADISSWTVGSWHHVAFTITGTTQTIYLDGNLAATSTGEGSIRTSQTTDLYIGETSGGVQDFQGSLDELKIYHYARSADQIKADFAARGGFAASAVLGARDNSFLSDGLVGYWKMDESSWTNDCSTVSVLDSSGNGYNGEACPDSSGPTGGVIGKFGLGGSFDGDDDRVQVANATSIINSTSGTVALWFNPSSTQASSTNYVFAYEETNPAHRVYLRVDDDTGTTVGAHLADGTTIGTASITADTWNHMAVTWEGTSAKFIVNGTDATSTSTFPGFSSPDLTTFQIGALNGSGNGPYTGSVDEVRIYNRTLSSTEIKSLYNWAPGPVGYWKLDEGSWTNDCSTDTAFDSSGNGANAVSCPNTSGPTTSVTGKFGKAGQFDGNDDYLYVGNPAPMQLGNADFTFSTWVKTTQDCTGNKVYLGKRNSGGGSSIWLGCSQSGGTGRALFQTRDSDNVSIDTSVSTVVINDGNWHYLTGVRNGNTVSLYVDGKLQNSASGTYTGNFTDGNVSIGRFEVNPYYYTNGTLDEVKIYNYARTPSQIIQDMNGGHPLGGSPVGSQVLHWAFDENYGTTANDSGSGSSSNGILSGTPPTWTQLGKIGNTLEFSTSGEFVYLPTASDSEVDFGTGESFSGSVWYYPVVMPGTDDQDAIITKWDQTNSQRGYRLIVEDTNNFKIEVYDESADEVISASTPNDFVSTTTWYHIGFTFNGGAAGNAGDLKLYVNGNLISQNAANASFLGLEDVTSDFVVGQYDPQDAVADNTGAEGRIDEVKIYAAELTAQEMLIDFNAGAAINFGTGANSEASTLIDGAGNPPIGYWPLDEKTGQTAYDKSGNGYNGTLGSSSGSDTSDPQWTQGKIGAGLLFDGSDDYVDMNDINALDLNDTADASITGWFYRNSTGFETIISKYSAGLQIGYLVSFNADDELQLLLSENEFDTYDVSTSTTFTTPGWHHFAIIWDQDSATNTTIYIDGVEDSPSKSGAIGDIGTLENTADFRISSGFDGKLDDIKFFNYPLTAAQVAYEYNRGLPIGHWQFDECSGTVAYDNSGNGLNGTITPGDSSGDNDTVGSCNSGVTTEMWNDGTSGKFNASLGFDGTNDYVDLGDPGSLQLTGAMTVMAWVKFDNLDDAYRIFAKQGPNTSSRSWSLNIENGNPDYFSFMIAENAATVHRADGPTIAGPEIGIWTHVVGVYSPSNYVRLYKNGNLIAENTASIPATQFTNNGYNINIGRRPDGTGELPGQIDDVRIYNYALSATQVKQVMNGGAVSFR